MAVRAEALGEVEPAATQPLVEAGQEQDRIVGINGLPLELAQSEILTKVDIIGIREGGLVECFVPFTLIDNEEVPVKEEWAQSLARQMGDIAAAEGGTGQHMPVTLGFIPEEPTLKIMDGFHRSAGLRIRGEDRVYASVKLTDWDQLYDFRIFTAKDHKHVRFSRVVQWIQEVWDKSPLSELEIGNGDRLTVAQAMVMRGFESKGARFNMDPDDAELVKEWVARKEHLWGLDAMTIYQYLKVAESVDPKLVHSTREKSRGDLLEAPTQDILKIFAKELPNNFDLQNLVLDTAKAVKLPNSKGGVRTMYGPEIRTLCRRIADCATLEEAQVEIAKVDWKTFEPEFGETTQRALRRAHDPRHKGAAVLGKASKEIAGIRERIKLSHERNEGVDEEQKVLVREARAKAMQLINDLGSLVVELSELIGEKPPAVAKTKAAPPSAAHQRAMQELEDTGLGDLIPVRHDQQMSPNVIHGFVDRCLRGMVEVEDIPIPRTPAERRQFRVALGKAVEMPEGVRVGNWKDRYRELQLLENPALAEVLK